METQERIRKAAKFNFSVALQLVKEGKLVSRVAWWNDKEMFIYMVPGSSFRITREPLLTIVGEDITATYRPHIDLKDKDDTFGVWTPSMDDLLAVDWYEVPNEGI